jgi:hypothetical protein
MAIWSYISSIFRFCFDLALRAFFLIWLLVHFALTIIYVMPVTPLKIELQPILSATIGRYFNQNWSLFAPNPVSTNEKLFVKCLTKEEVEDGPVAGVTAANWHDLSTPFWQAFQRNRFSAYERLGRPGSNAMRTYLTGGVGLTPWFEACRKGDTDSCLFYQAQLKSAREQSVRLLRLIGSSFCKAIAARALEIRGVAFQIEVSQVRRWSRRNLQEDAPDYLRIGAFPIRDDVVEFPVLGDTIGAAASR